MNSEMQLIFMILLAPLVFWWAFTEWRLVSKGSLEGDFKEILDSEIYKLKGEFPEIENLHTIFMHKNSEALTKVHYSIWGREIFQEDRVTLYESVKIEARFRKWVVPVIVESIRKNKSLMGVIALEDRYLGLRDLLKNSSKPHLSL